MLAKKLNSLCPLDFISDLSRMLNMTADQHHTAVIQKMVGIYILESRALVLSWSGFLRFFALCDARRMSEAGMEGGMGRPVVTA